MSVRWEGLAGDTSAFALKLTLAKDPDGGVGASDAEAASWGSFELWVEGENLCRHEETGEYVEAVHWYVLPLIEWLIDNWDPLFHEEKPPVLPQGGAGTAEILWRTRFPKPALSPEAASEHERRWGDWWSRHCLLAARAGGPFPNVFLRRSRDSLEVSWRRAKPTRVPQEFRFVHSEGTAEVDLSEAAEAIHEVIGAALKQIQRFTTESGRQRIADLLIRHAALKTKETTQREAWIAGLGTSAREHVGAFQRMMGRLAKRGTSRAQKAVLSTPHVNPLVVVGSAQANLAWGSLSPTVSESDAVELAGRMIDAYADGEPEVFLTFLKHISRPEYLDDPSHEGSRLAEEVLEELNLPEPGDDSVDIDEILSRLGVSVGEVRLDDDTIRGVAFASPKHTPTVLVNRSYRAHHRDEVRRFTKAHELCHLLVDRGFARKLAIASGPWAPGSVEQRANSFAAALLMPEVLVRKHLDELGGSLNAAAVEQLARKLGTSGLATVFHLRHTGFFKGDADLLYDTLLSHRSALGD